MAVEVFAEPGPLAKRAHDRAQRRTVPSDFGDAPIVGLFFADSPTLFAPIGSRVRSVAPQLYSIPLFSVYNGKDVAVGRPSLEIGNAAACSVPLEAVMREVRELLAQRPALSEVRA